MGTQRVVMALSLIVATGIAGCKSIDVDRAVNGAITGAFGSVGLPAQQGGGTASAPPQVLPGGGSQPQVEEVGNSKIEKIGQIKFLGAEKNPQGLTKSLIKGCFQAESGGKLSCNSYVYYSKLNQEGWVTDKKNLAALQPQVLNSGTYLIEYSENGMNTRGVVTLQSGLTNNFTLHLQ